VIEENIPLGSYEPVQQVIADVARGKFPILKGSGSAKPHLIASIARKKLHDLIELHKNKIVISCNPVVGVGGLAATWYS
jgi:hypothetical protein